MFIFLLVVIIWYFWLLWFDDDDDLRAGIIFKGAFTNGLLFRQMPLLRLAFSFSAKEVFYYNLLLSSYSFRLPCDSVVRRGQSGNLHTKYLHGDMERWLHTQPIHCTLKCKCSCNVFGIVYNCTFYFILLPLWWRNTLLHPMLYSKTGLMLPCIGFIELIFFSQMLGWMASSCHLRRQAQFYKYQIIDESWTVQCHVSHTNIKERKVIHSAFSTGCNALVCR